MAEIIIGIIIAAAVVAAIVYIVKKRKKGECIGCSECNRSGGCSGCPMDKKQTARKKTLFDKPPE
ncbi:hypothetical protein CE91St36_03590 [Christensenellaceae bacterium]|nr:hypothetical protein CE91St36_03590 [Christensenellaceae bacterium]BDF60210.1 hypothetical protein CE91St37_03600 [Christensenellaceae bacterium]